MQIDLENLIRNLVGYSFQRLALLDLIPPKPYVARYL